MKKPSLIALLLLALLPFQNCISGPMGESPRMKGGLNLSGGNGSGYDGKLFVHLSEQACADGLGYDAAIVGRGADFVLTRENCVELPDDQQRAVTVDWDPARPDQLRYQNQIFVEYLNISGPLEKVSDGFVAGGHLFSVRDKRLTSDGAYFGIFEANGSKRWARRIVQNGIHSYRMVKPMPDGGLVVHLRHTIAGTNERTWLTRYSRQGERLWSKQLIDDAGELQLTSMHVDGRGDILLAGAVEISAKLNARIVKVDDQGRLVSAWTFEQNGTNSRVDLAVSPTGEYHLQGVIDDGFIASRVDSNMASVWSNRYPELREGRVIYRDNGEVLLRTKFRTLMDAPVVIYEYHERWHLLNSSGQILSSHWLQTSAGAGVETNNIVPAADGGFYFTRYGYLNYALVRVSPTFQVEWARTMPPGELGEFSGIERLPGGQIVASFMKMSSLQPYSAKFMRYLDMSNFLNSCANCTVNEFTMSPAPEAVVTEPGPRAQTVNGVRVEDLELPEFPDMDVNLPFVP